MPNVAWDKLVVPARPLVATQEVRRMTTECGDATIRRSDLDRFLSAGGRKAELAQVSEDPSFSKHTGDGGPEPMWIDRGRGRALNLHR
jgi:hypothetical protein